MTTADMSAHLSGLPTNDRGERLITHLRHVDLAVPDYDKQLRFYTEVWGLAPETTDEGIAFLAAEGSPEQYSVRLRRADEKRLDLISFGAVPANPQAMGL